MPCRGSALAGLDVTIPQPLGIVSAICILYSIVPWAAGLVLIITMLIKRRTSLIIGVALLVVMIILSEVILKNIVKQPRPSNSCLTSSGMPSSHSVLSLGFVTFSALEMFFHQWQYSRLTKLQFFMGSVFLLVPVPASRVGLGDHSPMQVGVGIIVGAIIAIVFFVIMHFALASKLEQLMERPLCVHLGLSNDYVVNADDVDLIEKVRNRTAAKYVKRASSVVSMAGRSGSASVLAPGTESAPAPLASFKAFTDDDDDGKRVQLDGLDGVDDDKLFADPAEKEEGSDEERHTGGAPRQDHDVTAGELTSHPMPNVTDEDDILFVASDED